MPDPIEDLLRKATLNEGVKATAWDAVMGAADDAALDKALRGLPIPDALRAELWDAKHAMAPPTTPQAPATPRTTAEIAQQSPVGQDLRDMASGARAMVMNAAYRGGDLIRRGLGMERVIETPEAQAAMQPPETIPGQIGYYGSMVLPGAAVSRGATATAGAVAPRLAPYLGQTAANLIPRVAVEAAGGGALAASQGGDPTTGAAISGAIPVVGAGVRAVTPGLKESAIELIEKGLGGRKERFKAVGERIAPEFLKRRLGGSLEKIAKTSAEKLDEAGEAVDDALQQIGTRKVSSSQPLLDAMEQAKDAYRDVREISMQEALQQGHVRVTRPTGFGGGTQTVPAKQGVKILPNGQVQVTVITDERPIAQFNDLQRIIRDLGPNPTVQQLVGVRRTWDMVVGAAGGYEHRAPGAIGQPLLEWSEAKAKYEATTAIRELLSQEAPELSKLNKEYNFWKNLNRVATTTLKREAPQGASLGGQIAESGGQVAAAAALRGGGVSTLGSAWALGRVAKMFKAVTSSPRYRFASAKMKDDLADAIMNNNVQEITAALGRISAVGGSHVVGGTNGE